MDAFEKLPLAKKMFFKYIVSNDNVTNDDFEELRKVSSRAFQYGKANTNARYREHVLLENGTLCCDYCGKNDLKHNRIKTHGTLEEFTEKNYKFFYGNIQVDDPATVDHINPISLGADVTNFNNLTISCEQCNSDKGSMTFSEWFDYMDLNKNKFNHFFNINSNLDKFKDALNFKPHMDHLITFDGVVKMNREDLSPYLRYKLGYLYDTKWQQILSPVLLNKKYDGALKKPNLKTGEWLNSEGVLFDINNIKIYKLRKSLDLLKNDVLIDTFMEIHNFKLNKNTIKKWINLISEVIDKKTTTPKKK